MYKEIVEVAAPTRRPVGSRKERATLPVLLYGYPAAPCARQHRFLIQISDSTSLRTSDDIVLCDYNGENLQAILVFTLK